MWINRIRGDFQRTLVVAFGIITVLGITPFAVYRFTSGQLLVGLVDVLIVACIAGGALHAIATGRTRAAATFLACTYTVGLLAVARLDGFSGLLWTFPVLLANYLLVGRRSALLISSLAIGVIVFTDPALHSFAHKTMFGVTSLVVSLFSYVFAWRSELQRAQLEAIALHDPLTGASNRRGLHEELDIAIAECTRHGRPLGLLVFDLDHFKQVNDRFGHEAGDGVLVSMATLVTRSTRKEDRFFRLGGEEFGLLLPGADARSLCEIAEKLRSQVEHGIQCGGEAITVSLGATPYVAGEPVTTWQRRADAAMYQAKRNGRNCWVVLDRSDDSPHETVLGGPVPGLHRPPPGNMASRPGNPSPGRCTETRAVGLRLASLHA
jgi:diguanylate cyclase (GGDEF)-like protein